MFAVCTKVLAYSGVHYIGIIGLNVIKANDYMNVILQVSMYIVKTCNISDFMYPGTSPGVSISGFFPTGRELRSCQTSTWRPEYCCWWVPVL